MIGIMEPLFWWADGHPDRFKNEQISDRSQAVILARLLVALGDELMEVLIGRVVPN